VDHPYAWLKYFPAKELDAEGNDLRGIKVVSPSGENLGKVEGFIVDDQSGRPYYAVVDASGWFKSKHFLLPVGHARLDSTEKVLRADLTKDHVERFPGFDLDKFDKLTVDDLKRFNEETLRACTVSGVVYTATEAEPYSAAWSRPDFAYPDWWKSRTAADRIPSSAEVRSGRPAASSFDRSAEEREAVVARAGDTSPHYGGRAQPGDVIGVETGGEQTHVGETGEDEDKRRERAERDAEKARGRP